MTNIYIQILLFCASLVIVAFGQGLFVSWVGIIAAGIGYTLFFRILLDYPSAKKRFWLSTFWFFLVQLLQNTWVLSHPFYYMYIIYFLYSFAFGIQFGIIAALFRSDKLQNIGYLIFLSSFWTIMEWIRQFPFAGFSWNFTGLALADNIYSMQTASLWGIYGLSFWVIFTNLLGLKFWCQNKFSNGLLWVLAFAFPYVFGFIQLTANNQMMVKSLNKENSTLTAVLVQSGFQVNDHIALDSAQSFYQHILSEWKQLLKITKKQIGATMDLLVFPESTVPYGAYNFIYPQKTVENLFSENFGPESVNSLPELIPSLALKNGNIWMVNNAYWAQALANFFNAGVIVGLQDVDVVNGDVKNYISAIYFQPNKDYVHRYDKQVLLPMGEYIPFAFLRDLAARYHVAGSFTHGKETKVITECKVPFSLSICYEEILGHLIRESKSNGAELLINITNDAWYPGTHLPKKHFELARLRTVENGLPLIRACNTGVTGAIASTGEVIAILGENSPNQDILSDSLKVVIPTYHYTTLYSKLGDWLIIGFSFLVILFFYLKNYIYKF